MAGANKHGRENKYRAGTYLLGACIGKAELLDERIDELTNWTDHDQTTGYGRKKK